MFLPRLLLTPCLPGARDLAGGRGEGNTGVGGERRGRRGEDRIRGPAGNGCTCWRRPAAFLMTSSGP